MNGDSYAGSPRMQLTIGERVWGRVLLYLDENGETCEDHLVDQFDADARDGRLNDALHLLITEGWIAYESGRYSITSRGQEALGDC